MNETEIGYTKSADRGKPIQESLNPSDPLSERSSGKGKERVQRVMDLRDDNREHDSLRSLMCRRTMPELTIDLLAHGIPDASLKGKKKADLVELAMDELMPHTLEDFVVLFLPVGGWYVRYLQGLVAAGGRGIVTKRDVRAGVNSPLSLFPVTLLSDQPYEFVIRVPQEALDLLAPLTDEVWDEYARIADRCADFGKYLACAADLCGLVPIQEVADAWAKEKGIQMEGLLQRVIRDAREWADMQSLHVIDVDSLSYAVCSVFFDEYKPRDGSLGMEHVHHLIGEHQKVDRHPVQKRHLEAKDVYAYVLETP